MCQDLFGYDLLPGRRRDATPVAAVEGEVAFSAYSASRLRQIVEHLHQTARSPTGTSRTGDTRFTHGRLIPLVRAQDRQRIDDYGNA